MMKCLLNVLLFITTVAWSNSKDLNDAYSLKADIEEKFESRLKNFVKESNLLSVKGSKVEIIFLEDNFIKALTPLTDTKKQGPTPIPAPLAETSPLVKFDFDKKTLTTDERNRPSVYKFFKTIKATIYFFPESKPEEREKILEFLKKNYSKYMGIVVQYEARDSLTLPLENKVVKGFFEDRQNLILTGTFLVFLTIFIHWLAGFLLYRALMNISKSLSNVGESFSKMNEAQKEKSSEFEIGGEMSATKSGHEKDKDDTSISFSDYEGVKKFKDLLLNDNKIAHQMLKIWLNHQDHISSSACLMILRSLSIQQVNVFFKTLTIREKNLILKMANSKEEVLATEADHFILSKISSELIYAEMIKDQELIQLIQTSSPEKLTSLIQNNIEAGSYLIPLLAPEITNKVFTNLPDESFFELIDFRKGNEIPQGILNYLKEQLKSPEMPLKYSSSLIDNFLELIKNCGPGREEGIVLKALTYFNQQQVTDLILQYVPLFFIKQFSPEIKYTAFKKLANNDKIRFLLILDEAECFKFLDFTGEKGSKVRRVFEVDLELRRSQPVFMAKIKKDEQNIWFLYADVLRKLILTDVNMRDYVYQFTTKWIEANQNPENVASAGPSSYDRKAA